MPIDIRTNRSLYTRHLRGDGIEIGALHGALEIPAEHARVRYVDYRTTEDLRATYKELSGIVDVDVIAPAEDLSPFAGASLDFIVANHVVEHLADPLATLAHWRSKLRVGGILYMAFPNWRDCPDKVRPLTSPEHIVADFRACVAAPVPEHVLAFVWAWNPAYFADPPAMERLLQHLWRNDLLDLDAAAEAMIGVNRPAVDRLLGGGAQKEIHHHTFTYDSMKELLSQARTHLDLGFQLIDVSKTKGCLSECIFIMEAVDRLETPFVTPRALDAEKTEAALEASAAGGASDEGDVAETPVPPSPARDEAPGALGAWRRAWRSVRRSRV